MLHHSVCVQQVPFLILFSLLQLVSLTQLHLWVTFIYASQTAPLWDMQWILREKCFQELLRHLCVCARFHIIFISQLSLKHRLSSHSMPFRLPQDSLLISSIKYKLQIAFTSLSPLLTSPSSLCCFFCALFIPTVLIFTKLKLRISPSRAAAFIPTFRQDQASQGSIAPIKLNDRQYHCILWEGVPELVVESNSKVNKKWKWILNDQIND